MTTFNVEVKVTLSLCMSYRHVQDSKYSSPMINSGVRCRWAVSFWTRPTQPRYPLNRRLGGPQSRSRRFEKHKNFFPLPRIEPAFLGGPACRLVAIPTTLLPGYEYVVQSQLIKLSKSLTQFRSRSTRTKNCHEAFFSDTLLYQLITLIKLCEQSNCLLINGWHTKYGDNALMVSYLQQLLQHSVDELQVHSRVHRLRSFLKINGTKCIDTNVNKHIIYLLLY